MKIQSHLVIFGMIATLLLSAFVLKDSQAAELSDEQVERIKTNCLSIKGSLTQLHATDALLRVNRGQIYESMGTKLMNNFNSRLASNSFDNRGLVAVADAYQSSLTTFRDDYQIYERQLSAAIKVDCTKSPIEFHRALEAARANRSTVHDDVVRLHQYIDDYRSAVSDFVLNFERVTGKN